jgi:PiT family inorganic phosphate transporter
VAKKLIPARELYEPPHGDRPPPWWIRALLIGTCTGVSFAHGSNDGQKGMGLIMLVLIGIVPAAYALNMGTSSQDITATVEAARRLEQELSEPQLATMMTALKDQHLADSRVARIARRDGVAAAAVLESDMIEEVFDPYPGNDVVLATLDPLPLCRDVLASLDGRTSFAPNSSNSAPRCARSCGSSATRSPRTGARCSRASPASWPSPSNMCRSGL